MVLILRGNDHSRQLSAVKVNLIDISGLVHNLEEVFDLGDNAFAMTFIPPEVLFYWQITGRDEEGYTFSQISDAGIEVSTADITLGE